MKFNIIAFLLFLFSFAAASRPRVCKTRTRINHQSVLVPFSEPTFIKVPLILYYPCRLHHHSRKSFPLLVLVQGALLRPDDYSRLATSLARRRFIVAIPDYTQRRLLTLAPFSPQLAMTKQHVLDTRRAGFMCPRSPQFPSTQLITSVLRFFRHMPAKSHLRRIRKKADLKNVIVFGHSIGGSAADLFFSPACIPFSSPVDLPPDVIFQDPMLAAQFPLRLLCEQYIPFSSPHIGVAGLVSFDGIIPGVNITVPPGKFHVAINSPFTEVLQGTALEGVSVEGKLVRVLIDDSNHFAPNNFARKSDNQTPSCAVQRDAPEDLFTTTKEVQVRVIKSIVKTIVVSYKVFVRGRSLGRLTSLPEREDLSIGTVTLL